MTTDDLDIALGASGIDLDSDDDLDVTMAAVEDVFVDGGDRDDTIWAAGSTATGAAFTVNLTATGGDGDDTIASGAGDDAPSRRTRWETRRRSWTSPARPPL